ncbi:MAG: Asp-tRNA(Asn)/Glu-tRNA(Gln) amidotransferase subunit GatB [Betaproteobacteria bacterium]|nr:Asp-tRNA(Asn)/Glu-tRNA(Gln) amidotransferase subunit GatB [Betaproteobacteria bacterium]
MAWEIVVGIETHTQLLTRSKMFSGAPNAFGAAPNTQACAVDIALPGTLPVANRAAIEHAIRFGLAVNGRISPRSVFARKNYFYPDLPKGYQISQYEIPVVQGGTFRFFADKIEKSIRLTRAHLEEDAGKSLHENFSDVTGIDLNRAGTPLLEIVTEPELRGAKEAVAYARALHVLVVWIGICDGNMQEGSFRCDANVSVRKTGDEKLGTRCEIKNLNSFRFMEQAIEYEAARQIEVLEGGGSIVQQTRLYDADRNETRSMRSKEDVQDYRYFPDPDLLPLVISEQDIERVRASMPELPETKRAKLIEAGVPPAQANQITSDIELTRYTVSAIRDASRIATQTVSSLIVGPLSARLNQDNISIDKSKMSADQLRILAQRMEDGTLSGKLAKEIIDAAWAGEGNVDEIIEKRGLRQISDSGAIEKIVDEVLAANAKQVADYRAGKEKAFNSLVGQVMKRSQGKANPAQVNEVLRRKLTSA